VGVEGRVSFHPHRKSWRSHYWVCAWACRRLALLRVDGDADVVTYSRVVVDINSGGLLLVYHG